MSSSNENTNISDYASIEIDVHELLETQELWKSHLSYITTKGESDVHKIQLRDIDQLLSSLRHYSDVKITDLPNKHLKSFQRLKAIISLMQYPYSTAYLKLYRRIEKYFGDLKIVKPLTIGAYCIGCKISTNLPKSLRSYTPICSRDSVRLPDLVKEIENERYHSQKYSLDYSNGNKSSTTSNISKNKLHLPIPMNKIKAILLADYHENIYTFHHLDKVKSSNTFKSSDIHKESSDIHKESSPDSVIGIIYLSARTYQQFHGFTLKEKSIISSYGIKSCLLYGYNNKGTRYVQLTPNIDNILKHRDSIYNSSSFNPFSSHDPSDSSSRSSDSFSRSSDSSSSSSSSSSSRSFDSSSSSSDSSLRSFDSSSSSSDSLLGSSSSSDSQLGSSRSSFDNINLIDLNKIKKRLSKVKWSDNNNPFNNSTKSYDEDNSYTNIIFIVIIIILLILGIGGYIYNNVYYFKKNLKWFKK